MTGLRLDGNKLQCGCRTLWLGKYLRKHPQLGVGTVCHQPAKWVTGTVKADGDWECGRGLRIFSFPKKYFHFVMINESDKHQTDHRLIMTESFCQQASTHFIWLDVVKRSSAATAKISQIFNYFALTFFLFRLSGKSIATLLPYQFRCSGKKKCLFKLFCRLHYFEFWYSQIFFQSISQ